VGPPYPERAGRRNQRVRRGWEVVGVWVFAALALLGAAGAARAHHGSGGSQVLPAGRPLDSPSQAVGAAGRAPWLWVATDWSATRAGRLMGGTERVRGEGDPRVFAHGARLRVGVGLARGTELELAAAWLAVRADGGDAAAARRWNGPGDLVLGVRQDLGRFYGGAPGWVPRLRVGLLLELPTGRVDDRAVATVHRFETGGGALDYATYRVWAGLGQGAVGLVGTLDGSWRIGALGGIEASVRGRAPLSEARGGGARGGSVGAELTGSLRLWRGRLVAFGGLGARYSAGDRLVTDDEAEAGAAAQRLVLAVGGAHASLGAGLVLSVSAEVPVFASVDGVQLVESWGVSAGLSATFGLRRSRR
jgi:hypothetical protein